MRRRKERNEGQATVEMALVLPVLIWLLIGTVDIARMANAYLTVQHAAREAVRLGITGATDAAVTQRALDAAAGLDPTSLTVSVTPAGLRPTGTDVTVTVSYQYSVLALMGIIGDDVPLQGSLTARVE